MWLGVCDFFFFFKQKTAYEMLRSLVGSEMCIRDSHRVPSFAWVAAIKRGSTSLPYSTLLPTLDRALPKNCLLYTSDAADEEDSVDLGGRRIIKKKKKNK
eukprot:TRINITY_DN15297_c0_g1_i4.p1 TRINITY_DN15297_c0_g1~~TRINITY_DN15297_c0_g1_i4.p1  ORF type:complete len:100 (+),score=52.45 TRINITY_DN15297_c0_g1_i4:68-367(+)